jgi:imidazolonepropionase
MNARPTSGIERGAEEAPLRLRCDLVVRGASEIVTMVSGAGQAAPAGPGASLDLGVITRGAVAALDGRIVWTGPEAEIATALEVPDDAHVVDVEGAAVVPGFVDAHTHLTWAGERAAEYGARLGGATYLEIQDAGGGINSTVRATRAATEEQLSASAARRLDSFLRHGTTTLEAKTGYGLTLEDERKQLAAAKVPHPLRRVHTVLAAHLTPEEYAGRDDEYITLVCDEILPALAGQAEFVDVFCDEGAFSVAQARRVLEAGRAFGYRLKMHAEELAHTGGTALAASLGAVSADHLIHIDGEDIAALKEAGTVAVLLPGTSYTLHTTYAPAKELLAAGVTIALATDFNPGSCYSENLQMAISLACQEDRLTPAEALRAATLGGAAALGLQHEVGSLEPGKRCDLLVLDSSTHQELPYHWGVNLVTGVIAGGRVVVRDRQVVRDADVAGVTPTTSPADGGAP